MIFYILIKTDSSQEMEVKLGIQERRSDKKTGTGLINRNNHNIIHSQTLSGSQCLDVVQRCTVN